MISVRAVACVVLLVLSTGVGAASAGALDEAAERYRPYMIEGIGQALAGARTLRECAAAADRAGAKQAWIAARAGWERSEVFTAGFVPELDALIDAWPNADHGFHAIEARLFGAGQTDVGTRVPTLLVSKRFDEFRRGARGLRYDLDHQDARAAFRPRPAGEPPGTQPGFGAQGGQFRSALGEVTPTGPAPVSRVRAVVFRARTHEIELDWCGLTNVRYAPVATKFRTAAK